MKLWSAFLDDLMPMVPGCPQPMAEFHLRRAAQKFCERTLCWREWLDDQTTAGEETFYFGVDTKQEVVQLLRATLDGQEMDVISADKLPANWRSGNAVVRGIFTLDRDSYFIVPTPGTGVVVQTEVALKPSNTATGISDELFRHYVDHIALGAAARLHSTVGTPYSNPQSTARAQFDAAVAEVASDVDKAHSRTANRVRAHFL